MFIVERKNLIPVKVLVNNALVHVELFENKNGNIFLSSKSDFPSGTIYFAALPSAFISFIENNITLQVLFKQSPSIIIEIASDQKSTLYSFKDTDVVLSYGNQTMNQLKQPAAK